MYKCMKTPRWIVAAESLRFVFYDRDALVLFPSRQPEEHQTVTNTLGRFLIGRFTGYYKLSDTILLHTVTLKYLYYIYGNLR